MAALLYVGNHGLERLGPDGRLVLNETAARSVPAIRQTLAAVERAARAAMLAGLLFEDKGLTASIHYLFWLRCSTADVWRHS